MQDPADPDAILMLRVKQGDTEAFGALVEKYKQPIVNLLARTLRDPAEAEDLAQNVFVQAFKAAHRYQVTAKFSTWLYTIARNLCLNEIRRRGRRGTESMDTTYDDGTDHPIKQFEETRVFSPPDAMLQGELEQKIDEALQSLPEKQRMAILFCREEELSYEEMAKILDCSVSATKSLIHRARETLKRQLKPYLNTGVWEKMGP